MRKLFGLIFVFMWLGSSGVLAGEPTPYELLFQVCTAKVLSGSYGSSGWQRRCEDHFDLPNPFLLKCAAGFTEGFSAAEDEVSCRYFCEVHKSWGPWGDFAVPEKLMTTVVALGEQHRSGQCWQSAPYLEVRAE